MNDLNVLEVPLRNVDFLGPKQSALLLSSMNPYQNAKEKNIQLNDPIIETDIYDTTLGAFSTHSQFNDFIRVQDPYKTESDLNFDSDSPIPKSRNSSSQSTSKNGNDILEENMEKESDTPIQNQTPIENPDKMPIFDPIDEKQTNDSDRNVSSSSYLASYAYSYSYTLSSECEVVDESSNDKKTNSSRAPNRLSLSCDLKRNSANISDEEVSRFKKANTFSLSHDMKKMNPNNYDDDKDHVSWTFPQEHYNKTEDNQEASIIRTADKYKVDLNEDEEEALNVKQRSIALEVHNNDATQAEAPKLKFSPYFLVDASYQMVEEYDNEEYEYDEAEAVDEKKETKIQAAPESEMQLAPEQKTSLQSASPAPSTSAIINVNSDTKATSPNLSSIINEPSSETKRKSPRNKNVRFGNIANQQPPDKVEDLNMFSESACILSESERDCYKIEEI